MQLIGSLAAIGLPGHFELLILAVLVGVPVLVAVVALSSANSKKRQSLGSGKLTPCPDCEQLVSVRAQTCPHCGAPLKPSL